MAHGLDGALDPTAFESARIDITTRPGGHTSGVGRFREKEKSIAAVTDPFSRITNSGIPTPLEARKILISDALQNRAVEQIGIPLGVFAKIISPPVILRSQLRWHHQPVARKHIIVLVGVKLHEQPDLLEVVQAGNGFRLVLGLRERWKQHRRQNGNDGNDNEQFYEGKSVRPVSPVFKLSRGTGLATRI